MVDIAAKTPSYRHGSTAVGLRKWKARGKTKPDVVRVRASEEKYRKALRHGVTHKRFMADINQSVEWPNDTFTHRRLKEGSVVLDEEHEHERQAEPHQRQLEAPQRQARERGTETEPTKPAPVASRA